MQAGFSCLAYCHKSIFFSLFTSAKRKWKQYNTILVHCKCTGTLLSLTRGTYHSGVVSQLVEYISFTHIVGSILSGTKIFCFYSICVFNHSKTTGEILRKIETKNTLSSESELEFLECLMTTAELEEFNTHWALRMQKGQLEAMGHLPDEFM